MTDSLGFRRKFAVIAPSTNTCIYCWALRQNGVDDKVDGFGSLLIGH